MNKLRPILFSTEMVQAILSGRKTQTRRVVKVKGCKPFIPPSNWDKEAVQQWTKYYHPYGQPGDNLWVRETWGYEFGGGYLYKASHEHMKSVGGLTDHKWKPSIHMPFAVARIFLRIKAIRVERLQDISEADAVAEGIAEQSCHFLPTGWKNYFGSDIPYINPIVSFMTLWQSINGPESWYANPWVWVVEFERISRKEAGHE